jgi:hypothetical protein
MTAANRNPTNTNLLQSTKFKVVFDRLPGMTYFCQSANFPGVALTEIPRATPFVDLYHAGEKIVYDTFNITFLVDEDLYAWTEIHDWIRGLTFPTDFREYVNLARQSTSTRMQTNNSLGKEKPQYSQASLTFYTNKNNPNFRINFVDLFPTNLSTIIVNTGDTAENIMTADATFRFSYYDYERLK